MSYMACKWHRGQYLVTLTMNFILKITFLDFVAAGNVATYLQIHNLYVDVILLRCHNCTTIWWAIWFLWHNEKSAKRCDVRPFAKGWLVHKNNLVINIWFIHTRLNFVLSHSKFKHRHSFSVYHYSIFLCMILKFKSE